MTPIKFKPARARVLVEAVQSTDKVGDVFIPDQFRETKPAEAVVIAIGPANKLPIKVGDRVLTQRFDGTDVKIGERRYRLLDPANILAVIE